MNKVHGAATPHVIGTSSSSTASAGPPPRPEPRPQRGRDELHQLASFFDSDRRITELYRVLPSFFFTRLQKEPMNRIRPPEADMVGGWGVAQLSISFAYVHAWPIAKSLPSFYRVLRGFFFGRPRLYRVVPSLRTGSSDRGVPYFILFILLFYRFFLYLFFFSGAISAFGERSDERTFGTSRDLTNRPSPPAKGQQ